MMRPIHRGILLSLILVLSGGCGVTPLGHWGPRRKLDYLGMGQGRTMTASYYGDRFHGRLTANGERFSKFAMTAAHKTLPFNIVLRVTSVDTGRAVLVRINDRGPYIPGRDLDLSESAARRLGIYNQGVGLVRVLRVA